MIDARFRIRLPPTLYVADLSRAFPETTFRLLSGVRTGDTASELGEALTDAPEAVASAFRGHEAVSEFEVLERTDDRLLTTYETSDVDLYVFVESAGFPPEFPIEVRDGHYEFDLTGTRAEFDRFRETLEEAGTPYELLSKVGTERSDRLLTRRQEELLAAGLREGYFEVPRDCTLADLADAVGVDKSTASGIVRRGQARLIAWYLTGAADGTGGTVRPETRYRTQAPGPSSATSAPTVARASAGLGSLSARWCQSWSGIARRCATSGRRYCSTPSAPVASPHTSRTTVMESMRTSGRRGRTWRARWSRPSRRAAYSAVLLSARAPTGRPSSASASPSVVRTTAPAPAGPGLPRALPSTYSTTASGVVAGEWSWTAVDGPPSSRVRSTAARTSARPVVGPNSPPTPGTAASTASTAAERS